MPTTKTTALSSQKFLAIDSIRDGVVILKNGGYRSILMCSSVNFDLKSVDEQDAMVFQYQNTLNALDFSLQFVIHSRKLNITPYLDTLKERHKQEQNELIKIQISEYSDFIKSLVELSSIVTKTFYVVIPFAPAVMTKGGGGLFLSFLPSKPRPAVKGAVSESEKEFIEHKNQLLQRVDAVSLGLQRIGIRAVQLNTEELIEFYYSLYNPTQVASSSKAPPTEA